jgi:hypothetical protein
MADSPSAPKPPPNLRVADSESRECDNCSHYSRGKCVKYSNLPVDGEWLCDSWEKGSQEDPDKPDAEPVPVSEQARTTREAGVRVRAHFRRARRSAPVAREAQD